jgi:PAS domain S-box-containing protein
MAVFTNKKENHRSLAEAAKILLHPVLIGSLLAAIAFMFLISKLSINNLETSKFCALLISSSALMVVMLFTISRNLTIRIKSEADLQKSVKDISDYKHALDESAIVSITNQNGIIQHANDNFCRISKYSREELIGQDHRLVNSGHHSKEFMHHLWDTISNGRIWRGELMNRAKDGTIYWVDTTIVPFMNGNGKPYQYAAIHWNMTERKTAEEREKKSRANLNAIFEHTDAGIYSLDTNYNYIAFNQVLFNTLKEAYGLEIKPGDHVFDFLEKLDPEEAKKWKDRYSKALKGEILKFENEFHINGSVNFISFSIYPIWRNASVIGLSCFARDITKRKIEEARRKQLTADLIQRNKDLEQFSYIISHNLRGPVANILGLSNIIKDIPLSAEEKEKTLNYLFHAVSQLDVVIQDLHHTLEVKHNIHETREEVVFAELVEGIKSSLEIFIEKRNATIITDFSEIGCMWSIRSYIQSIFYNLISNSLKYAQPGVFPLIRIKSARKKDMLLLHFSDNGLGIDTELCGNKLFGLYQRFHTESEGKGMGLFMVKTQVEAIGGKISLQSTVNKGTEFTLEFPSFLEAGHMKVSAQLVDEK